MKKKPLLFKLSPACKAGLRTLAKAHGITLSQAVVEMVSATHYICYPERYAPDDPTGRPDESLLRRWNARQKAKRDRHAAAWGATPDDVAAEAPQPLRAHVPVDICHMLAEIAGRYGATQARIMRSMIGACARRAGLCAQPSTTASNPQGGKRTMSGTETLHAWSPDYAVAPGLTLQETLEELGMTQRDLASRSGLSPKTINRIVKGEDPVSPETANKLELVTGVPASLWNNLEKRYRERMAKVEQRERHSRIRPSRRGCKKSLGFFPPNLPKPLK